MIEPVATIGPAEAATPIFLLGKDQFLNSFSSCSISIANSFKIKPVPPALSGPHNYFFSRNFWFTEFFFQF